MKFHNTGKIGEKSKMKCEKCNFEMIEEVYNSMFYRYKCHNCGFVSTNMKDF